MDRLPKAAILTRLARELRASGSWCGETHMQKAVYLLQDLLDVPTERSRVLREVVGHSDPQRSYT